LVKKSTELGNWVNRQRKAHKKGNLNEMEGSELKRYDMLKNAGFDFAPHRPKTYDKKGKARV